MTMRMTTGLALAALVCAAPAQADDFWSGKKAPAKPVAQPTVQAATPAASPAIGQPGKATLADLNAAEEAVIDVWSRLGLTTRRALLVTRKADMYGDYAPRTSSTFAPGEPIIAYIEPVGYAWKRSGADDYAFGGTVDFELATKDGQVLGSQKAFQSYGFTSHSRAREFFLNLTINVNGADPGDYVLTFTVHDTVGGGSTRIGMPFTIAKSS